MKTNRTNWIKITVHETESFTYTLRYFTSLKRSWFGHWIYFWKVMHYRNSVLYRVLLFSEFYSSAMQISLPFDENWLGVCWRCLVATRFGGFTYLFFNFMIMLIEKKRTIIILFWYQAPDKTRAIKFIAQQYNAVVTIRKAKNICIILRYFPRCRITQSVIVFKIREGNLLYEAKVWR